MTIKAYNIYYLALDRKTWWTPGLEEQQASRAGEKQTLSEDIKEVEKGQ